MAVNWIARELRLLKDRVESIEDSNKASAHRDKVFAETIAGVASSMRRTISLDALLFPRGLAVNCTSPAVVLARRHAVNETVLGPPGIFDEEAIGARVAACERVPTCAVESRASAAGERISETDALLYDLAWKLECASEKITELEESTSSDVAEKFSVTEARLHDMEWKLKCADAKIKDAEHDIRAEYLLQHHSLQHKLQADLEDCMRKMKDLIYKAQEEVIGRDLLAKLVDKVVKQVMAACTKQIEGSEEKLVERVASVFTKQIERSEEKTVKRMIPECISMCTQISNGIFNNSMADAAASILEATKDLVRSMAEDFCLIR